MPSVRQLRDDARRRAQAAIDEVAFLPLRTDPGARETYASMTVADGLAAHYIVSRAERRFRRAVEDLRALDDDNA